MSGVRKTEHQANATNLAKLLLQRGYSVKASVRSPRQFNSPLGSDVLLLLIVYPNIRTFIYNPIKTDQLLKLAGAKERLHLFKADLLKDGSFDYAVNGCDGVFHTASPFFTAVTDPQMESMEPALKGTFNVLGSCSKDSLVKRVVVTSSLAAVAFNARMYDCVLMLLYKLWYVLSKTLAEEAAWKFAEEKGMDIVTINTAMDIGPLLQSTFNTGAEVIVKLLNGLETYPNSSLGWVNVKDVANAHIQAFENPSTYGRYCLVESVVHNSELIEILRNL